jgi:predicted  nucleic acid-binding Zn-ribbon protein
MSKDCLYCGLQFSDTIQFCPNCGRPTASGFIVRPTQESEWERLRRETKEKDGLKRQPVLTQTMRGEISRAAAHSTDRRDDGGGDGKRASTTA